MPKRVEKEKLAGKGTISQAEQIQVRLVKTAERLDTENMIVGPKEEAKRDKVLDRRSLKREREPRQQL